MRSQRVGHVWVTKQQRHFHTLPFQEHTNIFWFSWHLTCFCLSSEQCQLLQPGGSRALFIAERALDSGFYLWGLEKFVTSPSAIIHLAHVASSSKPCRTSQGWTRCLQEPALESWETQDGSDSHRPQQNAVSRIWSSRGHPRGRAQWQNKSSSMIAWWFSWEGCFIRLIILLLRWLKSTYFS